MGISLCRLIAAWAKTTAGQLHPGGMRKLDAEEPWCVRRHTNVVHMGSGVQRQMELTLSMNLTYGLNTDD